MTRSNQCRAIAAPLPQTVSVPMLRAGLALAVTVSLFAFAVRLLAAGGVFGL